MWLAPSKTVWEARFGKGTFPYGMAGRALKPLLEGADPEDIAAHLEVYLNKTNAQFVNLHRFAQTFAEWNPKQLPLLVDDDGVLTLEGVKALTGRDR